MAKDNFMDDLLIYLLNTCDLHWFAIAMLNYQTVSRWTAGETFLDIPSTWVDRTHQHILLILHGYKSYFMTDDSHVRLIH